MIGQTWERAIAAVIDGEDVTRGTAFFVGDDVALTCAHVLAAAAGPHVSLKPVGGSIAEKVIGYELDEDLDLALVRVLPRPDRTWLALSSDEAARDHRIRSRGFPRDHPFRLYPDGFPMDPARISGEITLAWRGQPVPMLVLDVGAEKGMSGAPAVDAETNAVIGVLRFREGDSHALAIPARAAMRRWPELPTSHEQPARSFADITPAIPSALAATAWGDFDPARLHCLVVNSEVLAKDGSEGLLAAPVKELLSSQDAKELWRSFERACRGDELLDGKRRQLPAEYSKANVSLAVFDVADAFASPASLDRVVRLVVQADLALFDVTGFEPGVMLLLGIRAATRRGVTINSYGGGWAEGDPIDRPFNLSDLSLSSHTPPPGSYTGEDPRIGPLAARICVGFDQLWRRPDYLDLPVYDSLRKLGAQDDARTSISLEQQVLMLCSYGKKYFPTWQSLRGKLKEALSQQGIYPKVQRLQDMSTPQLVSQALYERIRRCAGCVADWTYFSPSTFFELGVRLAVSPWSVVQILDADWLKERPHEKDAAVLPMKQITSMRTLLGPLAYAGHDDSDIGTRIAQQLIDMRERVRGSGGHPVRQAAAEALKAAEKRLPQLVEQLTREADALDRKDAERANMSQALFNEIEEIKRDLEKSALERRIAAWFYLDLRVGADRPDGSDDLRRIWKELGDLVVTGLYNSDDAADHALADEIDGKLT